jgi:hypothetical protein
MYNLALAKMAEINEFAEAEAQANLLQCAPPEFAKLLRLKVNRIGSVLVTMIPGLDFTFFNRIHGLGIAKPASESLLDEAIATFQAAGCQNYMVRVSPMTLPAQYTEWLITRGFRPGRNWAKVYRGNEPVPDISTDLRLETIGKDQADAFADVVLPVFGIPCVLRPLVTGSVGKPGWHHYVAFDRDKPVSAAVMFVNGEVAWMGWAGTLKTHRKRGGQRAIGARMAEEGMALGCKWFTAETTEDTPKHPNPSFHNMMRYGFKLAYLQRNYVHQPPASPVKKMRRALFITTYGLRFEWQRLMRQRKTR